MLPKPKINNNHNLASETSSLADEKDGLNYFIDLFKPVNQNLQDIYPNITERKALKTLLDRHGKKALEEKIKNHGNLQKLFVENNWEILENSADEILQATIEMENYFSHTDMKYSENPFHVLLKKSLTLSIIPERDFLKFNVEKFYIKPCDQFWKNNSHLFF